MGYEAKGVDINPYHCTKRRQLCTITTLPFEDYSSPPLSIPSIIVRIQATNVFLKIQKVNLLKLVVSALVSQDGG